MLLIGDFASSSGSMGLVLASLALAAVVALAIWLVRRDADGRIRTRRALEQSEAVLRDFLDNANDLIQMISPEGKILYANRAWREKLGYSDEETARLSLVDVLHPDSRDHCMAMFQRVLGGETVREVPAIFVAKDGRSITVEGNVNCRFEDGKPVQTRAIFRDVTERQRHERELRQTHEKLTRSHAELDAPSADVVGRDHGFGEHPRVPVRVAGHQDPQPQPRGGFGQTRNGGPPLEEIGVGYAAMPHVVQEPKAIVPELFGEPGAVAKLRIAHPALRREDGEGRPHGGHPSRWRW